MTVQYRFSSFVYEIVTYLEEGCAINYFDSLKESDDLITKQFSKASLVRKLARCYLEEEFVRDMRKNPEGWLDEYNSVTRLVRLLNDFAIYGIEIQSFDSYCQTKNIPEEEVDDSLYDWADSNRDCFEELFERYSREIEHLLFANRPFLFRLNLSLAEFLRVEIRTALPLKRVSIPKWVKNAVYHRDKARCVFCNSDLSGIVNIDAKDHFDHMVALADGGTNEVTNIQLACQACNLRKGRKSDTTYMYSPYWED